MNKCYNANIVQQPECVVINKAEYTKSGCQRMAEPFKTLDIRYVVNVHVNVPETPCNIITVILKLTSIFTLHFYTV